MKRAYLLSLLLTLVGSLGIYAQTSPDRLILKGEKYDIIVDMDEMDSIVFSDTDKEIDRLSLRLQKVTTPGQIQITATTKYGADVKKMLCRLVPCSKDDSTDLLEANMLTLYLRKGKDAFTEMNDGTYTFETTAGTYRVFVIALDEEGNFCDGGISSAMVSVPDYHLTTGYYIYGYQSTETDMDFPLFMIAQSELLGDMYPGEGTNTGYDWYRNFNTGQIVGPYSDLSYIPWRTLEEQIANCNNIIRYHDLPDQQLGTAYAYRALFYYTYMYLWEPVENQYTDVSDVLGLTVPIVTENTTEEEAANNPRATHREMTDFILSDLSKAEQLLSDYSSDKEIPTKACVYGLMARVYMWDGDYQNAATYARMAIDGSSSWIMSQSQWLDPKTGFNTGDRWMWKMRYDEKTLSGLSNFTGWMSGDADWGYNSIVHFSIDRSLYEKIGYKDFRKYAFIDPEEHVYDYESVRGKDWLKSLKPYTSIKFRCADGEYFDYAKGALVDLPLMRVEEFYFIRAEALAHTQGLSAGISALNSFMRYYRDSEYSCQASTLREFQLENLTQMRIEFWGEGTAFPMAKRIKPGVTQDYPGTNAPGGYRFNCEGIKPHWNFVIPQTAIEKNPALEGHNNPDPSGLIHY